MFDEFVKKQDEIRKSTRRRNLKSKFASDVYINISDDTIELINSFLILSEENHSNMYQLDRKEIIDGLKKEHTISYSQIVSIVSRLYNGKSILENLRKRIESDNLPNNLELSQSDFSFRMDNIEAFYHYIEEKISGINIVGRTEEELQENITDFKRCLEEIISQIIGSIKLYELECFIRDYEEYSKVCNEIISEIDKNNYPLVEVRSACTNYVSNFTRDNGYITRVIDYYNEYIRKVYEQQLTKPDDYKSGEDFKFIVHNLKGTLPDDFQNFSTPIVSTSLITQNTLGLYGLGAYEDSEDLSERSRYGFILPSDNILAAKEEDLYVSNSSDSKTDVFNGNRRKEPILSPSTIEERCLELAKNIGSDQLSEEAKIYSEVVVDGFHPIGIFCVTNGEGKLNYSYRNAKKLADELSLPLIEIDQSLYRKKAGLIPYTDYGKKILSLNIIEKLMPNVIDDHFNYMFIKEYLASDIAEEVCRIFDEQKEQSSYSIENMLDMAVSIIRDKIDYYKEHPNYFDYGDGVFSNYMYFNNSQYDYIKVLNSMINDLDNYELSRKNKLEESSDKTEYERRKSEFEQVNTSIKFLEQVEYVEKKATSHGKSL